MFIEGGKGAKVILETVKFGGFIDRKKSFSILQCVDYANSMNSSFSNKKSHKPPTNIRDESSSHLCKAVLDFKAETPLPYPVMENDKSIYELGKEVVKI